MVWPEKKSPATAVDKRPIGEGVFRKCIRCDETHPQQRFIESHQVCPSCGAHHPLDGSGFRKLLLDEGVLEAWDDHLEPLDPLQFSDGRAYTARVAIAQQRAFAREAIEIGRARVGGLAVAYGAFLFEFMGGSMGSVVGEKVTRLFERATEHRLPVILLQASGGARMQEGILSLMQMAKAVSALERLKEARLPYISVLLHPTTGGVAASFALLGDVNIAEPGALIGFAGPRVIESTIRQTLPEGFQRAEFLEDHGMVDMVVERRNLKETLARLVGLLAPSPSP